jgi:peptidoglycan/xylan/chitin deacetylase (PgdA/CDA1 family)
MPNMKRRFPLYGLFLACAVVFISCASRPAVPPPPAVPAAPVVPAVESFPGPVPRPIEQLARRVKDNDPALLKYFFQAEDSTISVMADWDVFRVTYDLRNIRPSPGGRLEVDFFIQETGGGGYLEDTLLWTISPGDSGVLLSMDDNYADTWREYFDFFDRHGAKITFFVTGGCSSFCGEALNRGHDIGYHTLNHLNLSRVSQAKFFQETLEMVESFREEGVPLRSFAYPFGFSEPWMREALAGAFAVQRGFGVRYRLYNREAIKAGYIVSVSIDNIIYKTDEEFDAALTMMLRAAKFIGGDSVVPLTTHTIDGDADWGISPRRLEFLFETMRELEMRFYCYRDF